MTGFLTFLTNTLEEMGHTYPAPLLGADRLDDDLGLDSLDLLEVIVALEDHYQVTAQVDQLATGSITVERLRACVLEATR